MDIKLLFTIAICLTGVHGCQYFKNPGLLVNPYQDGTTKVLASTNRNTNTRSQLDVNDPVPVVNFTYPINIMQDDHLNYFVRICENGYLELAPTFAELQPCKTDSFPGITNIDSTLAQAVIIADFIDLSTFTDHRVDAYHILDSDQPLNFNASNNVTGPSYCDLQIIAGIISDCEEEDRYNITVKETLVVTWWIRRPANGQDYYYQAIIAVANNNRTFVVFIYEDTILWSDFSITGHAKGLIHAANAGLSGSVTRRSEICGSTTLTDIEKRSNCRCAQPGHYVFETSEKVASPHGFCGNETGTNNCYTYYCLFTTTYRMFVKFKNYAGMDRAVFLNSTVFLLNDGLTGFQAPYGNNTIPLGLACLQSIVLSSNDTYTTVERAAADPCFKFDSTKNTYSFVLMLYNNTDGPNVTTDGSRIIVGTCDLDDLSRNISTFVNVSDIAKTSVAPITGQQLSLRFWSSRNETIKQVFSTTDTVQLGRLIFPAICFTPATQAISNVDAYAAYPTRCEFSNNPRFLNGTDTDNRTMTVVLDNGCLPSKAAVGRAGRLLEPFKVYPDSKSAITNPLCMTTRFVAFRWIIKISASKLYMRCSVKLCVNRQLFNKSRCFDSCTNTLVNADVTDADDAGRRRRYVDEEYDLVTSINVVDVIKPTTEEPKAAKECVDDVIAKGVIGVLVVLLVIATIMTIILFSIFQKQTESQKSGSRIAFK